MVESSDKTWSTGEGKHKPLQHSSLENPMNSMKRQKDGTLKDEPLEGVQYTTGEEWNKLLETVKNRGAWRAAVQGVRKSRTRLSY